MTATETTTEYDRLMVAVHRMADTLNDALGIQRTAQHRVTVGYVGNCDINGRNDSRIWSIFLPHPGRVGTYDDLVASWRTGDVAGVRAALAAAGGALSMARWTRDPLIAHVIDGQRRQAEHAARVARRTELLAYAAEHGIDWTPTPLDPPR